MEIVYCMLCMLLYSISYTILNIFLKFGSYKTDTLQFHYKERFDKIAYRRVFVHDFYDCKRNRFANLVNGECPKVLQYPCYFYSPQCFHSKLAVLPCTIRSSMTKPPKPLLEHGIVFYVYSDDRCKSTNKYMAELEYNIKQIKSKEPRANIALVTNCDVRVSIAQELSVLIPVHEEDLVKGIKQWYTRVLYNAFLPFQYSFIIDSHVFPCYNTSYSELFRRFKESDVDISLSNRMNINSISGGAVLSRWGSRSFNYWMRNAAIMKKRENYDDQFSAIVTLRNRTGYTFRKLSSNWFFASHGITEKGQFLGNGKCYRSSVVITGPVQWVHGSLGHCTVMNGKQNEHVDKYRVYFLCRNCECTKKGEHIATSDEMLKSFIGDSKTPKLLWEKDDKRDSRALFWDI